MEKLKCVFCVSVFSSTLKPLGVLVAVAATMTSEWLWTFRSRERRVHERPCYDVLESTYVFLANLRREQPLQFCASVFTAALVVITVEQKLPLFWLITGVVLTIRYVIARQESEDPTLYQRRCKLTFCERKFLSLGGEKWPIFRV